VFTSVHRILLPRWRSWWQAVVGLMGSAPLQVAYYRSKEFQRRVDDLLPSHDLIWCHLVRTAPCARQAPVPRWLEMTDSIALTLDRASRVGPSVPWLRRFAFRTESRRMAQYEHEILKQFDLVSLISEIDRQQAFADLAPSRTRGSWWHPTASRCPTSNCPPRAAGRRGSPSSAAWILVGESRCALVLRREACGLKCACACSEARLHVIGLIPEADARRLRNLSGVSVEGVVPLLSDVLQHCRVGICPVRFGAGMQNKVSGLPRARPGDSDLRHRPGRSRRSTLASTWNWPAPHHSGSTVSAMAVEQRCCCVGTGSGRSGVGARTLLMECHPTPGAGCT
jgi:hypothetical protein